MNKDTYLILLSRGIRTFPFGYLTVVIPIYLAATGSALLVGTFFFVSIMASMIMLLFMSTFGHRFSVRSILIFQSVSIAVGLCLLSYTSTPALILLAAAFSVTNWAPGGGSGTGAGPYNTTLNLFLSEKTERSSRTFLFSISAILGTLSFAAGAYFLTFANFSNVSSFLGVLSAQGKQQSGLFVLGAVIQIISAIIIVGVPTTKVKHGSSSPKIAWPENTAERTKSFFEVMKQARKFVVAELLNGFGNGLFLRLIPLWFFVKFSLSAATIGEITAIAGIITAFVLLLSPRLERMVGPTGSVLFGRGAYAFLVVVMAIVPSLVTALILYYVTLVVSRVAAPIQQSFVFTKIPKEDWTRTSGMVGTANSIGSSLGPILGAYLLLEVNTSLSFIVALPFLLCSALIYGMGFRAKYTI